MTYRFILETHIAAPVEAVFALASDIGAHLDSMAGSSERAVSGVVNGRIGLGEDVTWRAKHFGLWWTMTSKVTELDEPHRFVDEQQRGPFKRFHHEHQFTPADGGTTMTDAITFAAPMGFLGRIAEAAVLNRYMPKLIAERNSFLKQALER